VKNRKLFLLAVLLVLFGLFAHLTALRFGADSAKLTARAVAAPADSAIHLRAERDAVNRRTMVALFVGVACAILSALFTFFSYRAEEPAPRAIVVVLLLFYGILHFAVV
jgi:hypothetical protein